MNSGRVRSFGDAEIQQAIAEHFREQARWRRERAAEYPDDHRNVTSAAGLEELADYVLSLPPSDERLRELGRAGMLEGLFSPPSGGAAAYAISRFRFRSSAEGYDRFLTVLVSSLNKDAAVEATQFGWIDE
jgi:hypothetical protein